MTASMNTFDFAGQLDKLNESITMAEVELHETKIDELDVEVILEFAQYVLLNASQLWMEFPLEQKQRFQKVLFPQGVEFSEGKFGTPTYSLLR